MKKSNKVYAKDACKLIHEKEIENIKEENVRRSKLLSLAEDEVWKQVNIGIKFGQKMREVNDFDKPSGYVRRLNKKEFLKLKNYFKFYGYAIYNDGIYCTNICICPTWSDKLQSKFFAW